MNVNLNSISLQQRKFSGTNSIGGIHLPDFNDKYVFSKKKSNTSNVEYKKQTSIVIQDSIPAILDKCKS